MMKRVRKLVTLSLVTSSLFLVSCRENKSSEPEESMEHEMHEGEHMQHDMSEDDHNHSNMNNSNEGNNEGITAEFQDEQVASFYENYTDIKTALVETNSEMAKSSAEELLTVIESDQAESDMATAAELIANSNNVQEQRQAFSQLTKAIEGHLREGIISGKIYKQYCPMAFEGKGDSWFSNSKEIRNPYYGEKMLNCGKVEETINQQTL